MERTGLVPDQDLRRLVAGAMAGGVYVLLATTTLGTLGLDTSPLIAGVGITGLTIGFALRDIASNYLSGMLMLLNRPFRRGHYIVVGDYRLGIEGYVDRIDMRYTYLRPTLQLSSLSPNPPPLPVIPRIGHGPVMLVPNSIIANSSILVRDDYTIQSSPSDAAAGDEASRRHGASARTRAVKQ